LNKGHSVLLRRINGRWEAELSRIGVSFPWADNDVETLLIMRGEKLKLDADAYITVLYTGIPAHNVRNCIEEKDLEVVEKLGGPCGGRTCGPADYE